MAQTPPPPPPKFRPAYPTPFAVVGLPRSRTAWLAEFLSYGDRRCWHELTSQLPSFDSLCDTMRHGNGVSDTMLALRLLDVVREVPDLKIVVVRRPRAQVYAAMQRLGLPIPIQLLEKLDDALDVAECHPNALTFDYKDLSNEDTCAALFRHCLGEVMPPIWFHLYSRRVITCDHAQVIDRALKNYRGFQAIYGAVL